MFSTQAYSTLNTRALSETGFYFGVFLIIAIGIIFYWSIMTLVKASDKSGQATIQDLAKYCFGMRPQLTPWSIGPVGSVIVNFTQICLAWGGLVYFLILIGDIIPDLFRVANISHALLGRRSVTILISVTILLPVSAQRTLAGLAKFSYFAMAAVVFIIASLLTKSFLLPSEAKGNIEEPLSVIHFDGISTAVSTFAFAFACQYVLPLHLLTCHSQTKHSAQLLLDEEAQSKSISAVCHRYANFCRSFDPLGRLCLHILERKESSKHLSIFPGT